MKNFFIVFLFFFLIGFSQYVLAADGSSGCGAGWYVLKKNSLVSSSLRATTNVSFLNTVGMTFGTSNCSKHSIVQNDKKTIHFIEANQYQIVVDMARGDGEYIDALSSVMGCENVSRSFKRVLKDSYSTISKKRMSAQALLTKIQGRLYTDDILRMGCRII
jgi:hypothetical protein